MVSDEQGGKFRDGQERQWRKKQVFPASRVSYFKVTVPNDGV